MAAPTPSELLDVEEVNHSTLAAYAQQLQRCLLWDPLRGVEGQEKLLFVEALTEIAAMSLDSISMEIRRLLVVSHAELNAQVADEVQDVSATQGQSQSEQQLHLRNLIAALSARDVQLKCKAANAVGSLCISRVAGQQLLDLHGEQILRSVAKMATCKNQWAQGDAFFVLGWMVVIADEDTLQEVAKLLPTVVKCLHRNVNLPVECSSDAEEEVGGRDAAARRSREALASSEQASNFRVYALVLLLNFSQRNVNVFDELLEKLLPMLRDLVVKLLDPAPRPISDTEMSTTASTSSTTVFDASEYAEILRLAITLLSVLVDQLETAASQLLELKALPSLLKLKRVLETPEVVELVDEAGIQDIAERLDAVIETLVNCR
ncbi:Armadillo-type fold [Phytophthora cinnamomi]|uniref:Armadillo-type fold n=1 Tax=Phytophthora cinnamomi TaxID=4785 RepID=UPI00355A9641|nr:Armadillo-type fold [Phytophthora cinnamomi]